MGRSHLSHARSPPEKPVALSKSIETNATPTVEAPPPEPPYRAKNYLLVVAVNRYDDDGINDLNNCARDSEDIIQLLTEEFDFELEQVRFLVSLKENDPYTLRYPTLVVGEAGEQEILDQLKDLALICRKEESKKKEDPDLADEDLKLNVVIYFSGHGHFDKVLEEGYWIPYDARYDDKQEAVVLADCIPNSVIKSYLAAIPSHHTFVIADSCFSGSLFSQGMGKSAAKRRMEKDPSRWGLTAGRIQVVSDGLGDNSPFAQEIIRQLKTSQELLGVAALCESIVDLVHIKTDAGQTPAGGPLVGVGHDNGQFYFRRKQNAEKLYALGEQSQRVAKQSGDVELYYMAARHYTNAAKLARKQSLRLQALLSGAQAYMAAGNYTRAMNLLADEDANEEMRQFRAFAAYLQSQQEPEFKESALQIIAESLENR